MLEMKPLNPNALASAQEKALRYRLLNQPRLAESICRDILAIDPNYHDTIITLVLCLGDQLSTHEGASVAEALDVVARLKDPYEREYYSGIVCERRAIGQLQRLVPGTGAIAHDWFHRAMEHYERAEELSPEGNVDAVLRWNTCARILNARPDLRPAPHERVEMMLE
ncbi:MAG TPA: hypothetical protein VK849_11030 [Longimicrobiales bacterium]|nr:hypothetical protein [Longimicrobiales bacterium]